MARGRELPWQARRRRQSEAEANDRWMDRHRHLVDVGLTDILWSNSAGKPYHLQCRVNAPSDVFQLSVDAESSGPCGACGRALNGVEEVSDDAEA